MTLIVCGPKMFQQKPCHSFPIEDRSQTHDSLEDALESYIEMRNRVDPEIRLIHSLAVLLSQFERIETSRVVIDPAALGIVHSVVGQGVLRIWESLDDFMLVSTARRRLDSADGDGLPDG